MYWIVEQKQLDDVWLLTPDMKQQHQPNAAATAGSSSFSSASFAGHNQYESAASIFIDESLRATQNPSQAVKTSQEQEEERRMISTCVDLVSK